jgi:hypothetical protein
MRSARVTILSLLILAGGAMGAGAQGAGAYYDDVRAQDYPLHAVFVGTNAPLVTYAAGLPELSTNDLQVLSGALFTDGNGHIDGLLYARWYFGPTGSRTNNYSAFSIRVTGKVGKGGQVKAGGVKIVFANFPIDIPEAPDSSVTVPVKIGKGKSGNGLVKMTLKGNGYSSDGLTNYPNANLSMTFTSTNTLVSVAPGWTVSVTSTNYTLTDTNGTTQTLTNGPVTKTNGGIAILVGKMKGHVKPGKGSPINNGNQVNLHEEKSAMVTAGTFWGVVGGDHLIERAFPGGLVVDFLTNLDAQVIQPVPGSKLWLNAYLGSIGELFQGIGTVNYDAATWNADFQGVAFARGSRFHAKGTLGPVIVGYDTNTIAGTTNPVPRIVQNGIRQVTINSGGRIFGQELPKMEGNSVPATPPNP